MYPFLFVNGGQATLHKDDIAIFSRLYPEPTFSKTTATISGKILGPNRKTPLTGVNVIARNVASPYDDAVSAISSDFTNDYAEDAHLVGTYSLRGLTPGAQYAVFVDQILEGGFSTPPRDLPNVEELYNGAAESNNAATDDPSVYTPVSAAAGRTAANINVIFNRFPEGPLALGDDGTAELFPPFSFKLCGQTYSSVHVNANGNVTFGATAPTSRSRSRTTWEVPAHRGVLGRPQLRGGRHHRLRRGPRAVQGHLDRRAGIPQHRRQHVQHHALRGGRRPASPRV